MGIYFIYFFLFFKGRLWEKNIFCKNMDNNSLKYVILFLVVRIFYIKYRMFIEYRGLDINLLFNYYNENYG